MRVKAPHIMKTLIKSIATPIVNGRMDQSTESLPEMKEAQISAKNQSRNLRRQQENVEANQIVESLFPNLQRAIAVSSEKRASTWLTTLSLVDHGFTLHKGVFHDAYLCLRYGWVLQKLPARCVCDQKFTIEHALSCSRGGFPSIRLNEIRDITAELGYGVGVEPCMQTCTR